MSPLKDLVEPFFNTMPEQKLIDECYVARERDNKYYTLEEIRYDAAN